MKALLTAAANIVLSTVVASAPLQAAPESTARPHWIPNAMELQDELRQAGYIVVWGEGDRCEAKVLPAYKTAVVCGENPVGDLRQAAWEVRTGKFSF